MSNCLLKELIKKFTAGDMTVFSLIYDIFKKLIFFYSGKLGTEDAIQELNMFLIELLYEMDVDSFSTDESNGLQKYIAVALRNKYIRISQKNQQYTSLGAELYDNEVFYSYSPDERISIEEALNTLSHKQRLIIVYRYIYCYSDYEIAHMLNISRQAVNRLRNRGLNVLRDFYSKNDANITEHTNKNSFKNGKCNQ